MTNSQKTQQGYLLATAAATQWGLTSIFGKAMLNYKTDPLTISALRTSLVLITLVIILACFRREWLWVKREDFFFFVVYSLVVAIGLYVYFSAIERVGASIATILLYTYPIFVTLLAFAFLDEAITFHKRLALALTVIGIALVANIYQPNSPQHAKLFTGVDLSGVLLGLLAALLIAVRSVFGKKAVQNYSNWTILLYSFGLSAVFLLAGQFVFLGAPNLSRPPAFWALLAGLAWISTLGGNLAYVSALARVEAGRASTTTAIQPVITTALAFVFFNETLSWHQIVGILLVLAGVLTVQR